MLKGKLPLILGIVLGFVAAFMTVNHIKKERQLARKGWELGNILVATTTIKQGEILTNDKMEERPMPLKFITEGMLKPDNRGFVIGQPTVTDIQQGDPLFYYDIQTTDATTGLSKMVKTGGRAVSLNIGGVNAVANWVRPNDHVDIVGIFTDPNTRQQFAMTLLENVIVIATGKHTGNTYKTAQKKSGGGPLSYGNITVYVLPQEAEILILAQKMGQLTLTLRNEEDVAPLQDKGRVTIETILTGERIMELANIRRKTIQIPQIIKGGGK